MPKSGERLIGVLTCPSSVPTHFFICGFLYPLSMKSAGMKLKFEGTR